MSDSLRPHESQHARPPCPSPTPGVHPNPCPLCRWCHPTILSSAVPFSSFSQRLPSYLGFCYLERGVASTGCAPVPAQPPALVQHPATSPAVIPFFSCPQCLPASKPFPVSQLFAWGGQSTGASASASFLPKKSQGWSPSEWTGWISLQSKGLSRVFSNATVQKHQFFSAQLLNCYI